MRVNIDIVPEGEDEAELIEMLVDAREYGIEQTSLDKSDIALLFNSFASGLFTEVEDEKPHRTHLCPSCGEGVEEVSFNGLGADPMIQPCGCTVGMDDIPDTVLQDILNS